MGKALVTSARTRVAYNICKSLARRGIEVVVADSRAHAMSFHSRHAATSALYTSPYTDEARFVDDLARIIERERVDVLIPVLEETYMVARNRERLGGLAGLCMAEYRDMVGLHDKGALRELAARCDVPMPDTLPLSDIATTPELADSLTFPVVVKPRQGGGGWAVEEVGTAARLREVAQERAAACSGCLVQRKMEGATVCVAMLYDSGRLLAKDTYLTLETYPWPYGQATLRESVSCPEAEKGLKALLDALGWTGVCEADFIVDAASGRAYLIDVNPRFWGSLVQSLACGVDFPYYYYKLAKGERDFEVREGTPGVVTRWLGGDLMRFGARFMAAGSKVGFLSETARSHRRATAFDDFDLSDPLPMLAWCGGHVLKALGPKRDGAAGGDALRGVWE